MKIILILILILILIIINYYCFAACSLGYKNPKKLSRWLKIDISSGTQEEVLSHIKSLPLDEKLNFFDGLYDKLSEQLYQFKDVKTKSIKRLSVMREFAVYNDLIIEDIARELNARGLKAVIKTKTEKFKEHVASYKYIQLQPESESSSSIARKLFEFKRRFDVKKITLDFYETASRSSRGTYYSGKKSVNLGPQAISSVLLDDIPTLTIRHEFNHARFASNRNRNGRLTKFDVVYDAYGKGNNLVRGATLYKKHMNAEELYNWANDPYWMSDRFKNIHEYTFADVKYDLAMIETKLDGVGKIANQTREMAHEFIQFFDELKGKVSKGMQHFETLNVLGDIAEADDSIAYLVFKDDVYKRKLKIWIPSELKHDAVKVAKAQEIILEMIEQKKQLGDLSWYQKNKIKSQALQTDDLDIAAEYESVLDFGISNQTRLKTLSTKVIKQKNMAKKQLNALKRELEDAAQIDSSYKFLSGPGWKDKFYQLRLKLKELADVTRK